MAATAVSLQTATHRVCCSGLRFPGIPVILPATDYAGDIFGLLNEGIGLGKGQKGERWWLGRSANRGEIAWRESALAVGTWLDGQPSKFRRILGEE
eukprot:1317448-Amorphochlora_amoeboformis.AAC.1